MKKLVSLTTGLLLFCLLASAQNHTYFAVGYTLGKAKFDSLNYIIDRYNETRNFLDKEMDNITFPNGFAISFGGGGNHILYDFTWSGKHRTVSAQGVDGTGVLVQRDLKFRWNTFNMGLGFVAGGNSKIGAGFSFDAGSAKIFTRVGPADEVGSMDYTRVEKELLLGGSVFLHFLLGGGQGPGLIVKPYYQFPYWRVDLLNVNSTINPSTYFNDSGNQATSFANFGVTLMLAIYKAE